MTSAPIELSVPQGPAGGTTASAAGAGSPDDGPAFAALVEDALVSTGSVAPPTAPGTSAGVPGDPAAGDPGSPEETAVPTGLEGVLAALLAAALAPPVTGRAPTPAPTGAATGSGPAAQAPAEGAGEVPTGPAATASATILPTLPAEVAPTAVTAPVTGPGTGPTSGPGAPAPHDGSTVQHPDTTAETSAPTVDGRSVTVTSDAPMRVAGGAVLPSTQAGGTAAAHPVAAQVIPEITRLVSDGDGVHRVTLQLNPKALGEVRVVLTMRQGDVHVRIAGGNEALQALSASSADLSRALHHLGLDEHRITLADLPGTTTTTTTRGSSDPDHSGDSRHHAQTSGGNDPSSRDQNGNHSRMGDAGHATDGSGTSSPTERNPASARISAVAPTRPAGGVDLRM